MNGRKNNKGFTMAEMLITVAILVVLAGLAFVAVSSYMRNMHQLEMDAIAKEIFVSAQNHLSMSESQGFPGINDFGTPEKKDGKETGIYYFIDGGYNLMLPDGAIDATVLGNGSFIIRYQKSPATVLDVFYVSTKKSGFFGGYPLEGGFTEADYAVLFPAEGESAYCGEGNKENRKDYKRAVIGWYGGDGLESGPELKAPSIQVINAERLKVVITDPNTGGNYKLQLIVKGLTSGKSKTITLTSGAETQESILDDICTSGQHFAELFPNFYPGENISVQAKVFSAAVLTNVATSELKITNSLFDTTSSVDDDKQVSAYISNIRHLENLSKTISACGDNTKPAGNPVKAKEAIQISDLSWNDFREKIGGGSSIGIFPVGGSTATNNMFRAIEPANALAYDGGYHSISEVTEEENGDAGLFAAMLSGSSVKNLELIDFSVTGTTSAGALAGTLTDCTVSNVLAHNSNNSADFSITATDSAGGLIGSQNGGTTEFCAAALIVNGGTSAGGLIGTASGTVVGCYSGGHTKDGSYKTWREVPNSYDVTGTVAGGLIGDARSAAISNSYSTCSVNGTTTAGGFVGSASGSITDCYCTGLVGEYVTQDKNSILKNAFIGDGTSEITGDVNYFQIVNEVTVMDGQKIKEYVYKEPGNTAVIALDTDARTYNSFVGNTWNDAKPYDNTLKTYYNNKYNLKTVEQLGASVPDGCFVKTHYGDWPAPEIFIVNS